MAEAATAAAQPAAWRGGSLLAWAAIGLLATGLLCLAYVARLELGPLQAQPLQVDELHFAACAARGAVGGLFSTAGCHDNKAPLMALIYQALVDPARPYDLARIKIVAFGVVLALALASAALARRLSDRTGAALTFGFVILAFTPNSSLLALKTETVGMLLVVLALLPMSTGGRRSSSGRFFVSGLLIGLATMTKQTYLVVYGVLAAWALWPGARAGAWRHATRAVAAAGIGVLLPGLALGLAFGAHGQWDGFLASFFLYPAVYAETSPWPWWSRLLWRSSDIVEVLGRQWGLMLLLVFGFARHLAGARLPAQTSTLELSSLLIALTGTLVALLWIAPAFFTYHAIPVWILAAVVGGANLAQIHHEQATRSLPFLSITIIACTATVATAQTLQHNHGNPASTGDAGLLRAEHPQRAYVLGLWHHFYVHSRMIPASQVMYPWALPQTPAFWAYAPPPPHSRTGRWLSAQQQANARQLLADFARTPPDYIVVVHHTARHPASARIADMPGFDEYLLRHCQPQRQLADEHGRPATLFACH